MGNQLNREASDQLNVQIRDLAVTGMTSRRIAEVLGVTHNMVRCRLNRLRTRGQAPSVLCSRNTINDPFNRAARVQYKAGVPLGSMRDLIACLSDEEISKLLRMMPANTTVAVFAAAIIKDTLEEEP